ncbi:MAG: hypothetical protein LKI25_08410 [Atopobiaceae bacterium]|jgi:hypothetical protein|nr:hypothetical protein [Atopobiaceae bacterium]MCI2174210.1 hypothetical protein [Atopobiaceae bacterium]MCI2206851.1 hypothetical protein [Atopobiaceae bacterium]
MDCDSEKGTDRSALTLFMLWQDSDELVRFRARAHLTHDAFAVTPMDRASALRLMGVIGIHAQGVSPEVATSVTGLDAEGWSRVRALVRLADERCAHTLDADGIASAWADVSETVPALRRAVANDVRVVRLRARWVRLLARGESDWPQPDPARGPARPRTMIELARLRECASRAAGEGFPATRLWLLPKDGADTDVVGETPLAIAVEHSGTCSATDAQRLQREMSRLMGRAVDVFPADQLHPLLWDETVARMLLVWQTSDTARMGGAHRLLPAVAHSHEHGHEHSHPHGGDAHGGAHPHGGERS